MKITVTFAAGFLALLTSGPACAWDGTDAATGNNDEIEQDNLVRSGETIEYIDHGTGQTREVEVEGITDSGSSVDVEVTDSVSGETHTLEMDPH